MYLRSTALSLLITTSMCAIDNLFVPIAQADLEGIRAWGQSANTENIDINQQFDPETTWEYGFHAPAPAAGDTPLLYAIRLVSHLWDVHVNHHYFNDTNTFKYALNRRAEIVRVLLFHPKCDLDIKNQNGQTALSYAVAERSHPMTEWILDRMKIEQERGNDTALAEYQQKAQALNVDEPIKEQLLNLISTAKVSRHEGVYREVLKLAFNLPWETPVEEQVTIEEVKTVLDQEHYGLKKVKEKILDFIAIKLLNPKARGKILCLVGPPGTGKTSIAQSIAHALKRKFVKTSLGGDSDPVRINGKERVYVGAHPGDIIKGMEKAKAKNPVYLLDEIDKLGHWGSHGDPAAALLEVLDPEQNSTFTDRYLDIPFDLSAVFFICTANERGNIPAPLRDRMEIVEISGYSENEKLHIAQTHLVPRAVAAAGLDAAYTFSDAILTALIGDYTFEAGVRGLTRHINTLCAKVVRAQLAKEQLPEFTADNLSRILGQRPNSETMNLINRKNRVGVANSLAAFPAIAGVTSWIEVTVLPSGKGEIKVTNQLGPETAQASATVAAGYARAHAHELGINPQKFSDSDLLIHVPGGGGDGPSAGITILSAIVSALTNKPVNSGWAMTGELSITGQVLPVGGVRNKVFAAKRMGITNIIIPAANKWDIDEDPTPFQGLNIVPVSTAEEVLNLVLVK